MKTAKRILAALLTLTVMLAVCSCEEAPQTGSSEAESKTESNIESVIESEIQSETESNTQSDVSDSKDKTVTLPKVSDGLINALDATKDEAYDACTVQELKEYNINDWPDANHDASGKFWACYDSEYIYVFVEVTDENIDYSNPDSSITWERESIGIIIDFDYNRTENYEYNYADDGDRIVYLNLSGDGVAIGYHMIAPDADTGLFSKIKKSTVSETSDGKILYEVALPIPDGYTAEKDAKVGFEILIQNAFEGERNGIISWTDGGNKMYKYTDVCGTVIFG